MDYQSAVDLAVERAGAACPGELRKRTAMDGLAESRLRDWLRERGTGPRSWQAYRGLEGVVGEEVADRLTNIARYVMETAE